MAERLVFDATAENFARQWRRFDWQLLLHSNVHRVGSHEMLEMGVKKLTELGYLVYRTSAADWHSEQDMRRDLSRTVGAPEPRPPADLLEDLACYNYGSDPTSVGTALALADFDAFLGLDPLLSYDLLDLFAVQGRAALLDGHPMLCLVQSETHLGVVGGTPVVFGGTDWIEGPSAGQIR